MHNNQDATFCRGCGHIIKNDETVTTNSHTRGNPSWLLFCRGLSIIMIIYGLFALATLRSEVYDQSYNGDGRYDYVVTEHHDGIGLIKSVGYGYSMAEGTSNDTIVNDAMNNGKRDYYASCFVLIMIGAMIGGISQFIYKRKKRK